MTTKTKTTTDLGAAALAADEKANAAIAEAAKHRQIAAEAAQTANARAAEREERVTAFLVAHGPELEDDLQVQIAQARDDFVQAWLSAPHIAALIRCAGLMRRSDELQRSIDAARMADPNAPQRQRSATPADPLTELRFLLEGMEGRSLGAVGEAIVTVAADLNADWQTARAQYVTGHTETLPIGDRNITPPPPIPKPETEDGTGFLYPHTVTTTRPHGLDFEPRDQPTT